MAASGAAGAFVLFIALTAPQAAQSPEDPSVRAAVERYYKTLEAEDIPAYLALWSTTVQPPQAHSLKFLFDSQDERYPGIDIVRTVTVGNRLRVRLLVRRERSRPGPGGAPTVVTLETPASITFVREANDWKVVSEGSPADDLAAALVAAASAEQREALLVAEPDIVDRLLVLALGRIAGQAAAQLQYARAQSLYERTLEMARRTGSRKEEGEALQNIGNAMFFQRQYPPALEIYQQRLALEAQRGDDTAMAMALWGVATIRYSMTEYTEALKRYRQALAIQERLDDSHGAATTLISTGNVRYLQGDFSGAIRDYSRSRELYRVSGDRAGDSRALEGLGRTYAAQGDYAAALAAFGGVLAQARMLVDLARQASVNQSIADVHLRLSNVDAARKHYEQSRDNYLATKNFSGAGRIWQGLGMVELLAARFDIAEQAYKTSAKICTSVPDDECSAHAVVGLAFALSGQEKYAEAIPAYRKAIEAFTALKARDPVARSEIGLSQALAGAGEIAPAIEAATRARSEAVALDSDDILWRALTAEARALRKSGARDNAIAAARAAAGVVERMQSEALEKPATAIPADASSALATLGVLLAEAGDATGAAASTARMFAIDLRNTLAVNEREIARGMTPDEREQERTAASELLSLLAQAQRERFLPKPDAARLRALEERIAAAGAARGEWMHELYTRLPDLRIWRGLATPPDTVDLLKALDPGTVLVELVIDEDDVLVISATGGPDAAVTAQAMPIRRRLLAERINTLVQPATLLDPAAWRKAALEIARLIPPAVTAQLDAASRVIVVPHDVMWRVPFEALPVRDGYLADTAQVIYAGSRATLLRALSVAAAPVKTVAAVGAPDLAAAAKERLQQTAPGWVLRPADAGKAESSAVAGVYGEDAVVLSGADATEAALRAKITQPSVLHIGAPFRINGASPLFSPILLTGDVPASGASAADDGALEAREVMNLSLAARVVMLTDGAATSMRDGAGAAGALEWSWLAAGVPSVVVARWAVDREASDALTTEFHRRVRAGVDVAQALHEARRVVRKRPEWAAPFYWAGWIGLGK